MEIRKTIILFFARLISFFPSSSNRTWIICEKKNEARDNGYWFYRYIREQHPEICVNYIITKDSPDYEKVRVLGERNIVIANSFKHCILYWRAKYSISSQPFGAYPFEYYDAARYLILLKKRRQITVFLQHGIIKDELSHTLDRKPSHMNIFCCSSKREQESVMQLHGYNSTEAVLTGLCRFDYLKNISGRKTVLVMPTFRHWLMSKNGTEEPTDTEIARFIKDDFYLKYTEMLLSKRLSCILEKYDYNLVFYPHYSCQCYLCCFHSSNLSSRIVLADRKQFDVQELLKSSSILITDFSSVFFDFAYLNKPVIYYQFDRDRYRSGHYKEGYFTYEGDGFGPVYDKLEYVLDYLERILGNNCTVEQEYQDRIDNFFSYHDHKNCERTYDAVVGFHKNKRKDV